MKLALQGVNERVENSMSLSLPGGGKLSAKEDSLKVGDESYAVWKERTDRESVVDKEDDDDTALIIGM